MVVFGAVIVAIMATLYILYQMFTVSIIITISQT